MAKRKNEKEVALTKLKVKKFAEKAPSLVESEDPRKKVKAKAVTLTPKKAGVKEKEKAVTLTPKKAGVKEKEKKKAGVKEKVKAVTLTPKKAGVKEKAVTLTPAGVKEKVKAVTLTPKKAGVKEVAPKKKAAVAPPALDESLRATKMARDVKVKAREMNKVASDATDSESEEDSDSESGKEKTSDATEEDPDSESGKENAPAADVMEVASNNKAVLDESESESLAATKSGKKNEADAQLIPAKRALMLDEDKLLPELKKEESVPFQRVWYEEDEILLLQNMLDFKAEKNVDAKLNYSNFYDYVKDSLDGNFDQAQVTRKIRTLLGKYRTYLNGKKKYLKDHEQDTINLSKLVWGTTLNTPASSSSSKKRTRAIAPAPALNGKKKREDLEVDDDWNFDDKLHMLLEMKENVANEALKKMKKMKAAEKAMIEETWKQFFSDEASLFARKLEAIRAKSMM